MKNNTLTKINIYFWDNIKYYFHCFKKSDNIIEIHLNDYENDSNEIYAQEEDNLLGGRPIKMNNRYLPTKCASK
jgi:hypothetical protein